MPRLLIDLAPLRASAQFRRLWIGSLLSAMGTALTNFALPLQIWDITRSTFAVGLLAAVQLIPAVTIGLLGGAWADARDRRRLLVLGTLALSGMSLALVLTADAGGGWLWLVYLLAAGRSGLAAVTGPVRRTFLPALFGPERLAPALALDRLSFQLMLTAGPAIAGVIVGLPALGLRGCYLIDAASFAGSLYGLRGLPAVSSLPASESARTLRAVGKGLAYVLRHPQVSGAFLADLSATVFALPLSLFPAINAERFAGNPHTLGLFSAAIGVGGLASTLLSGPVVRVRRQAAAMLVAVAVWGGAFAAFAVVGGLVPTLLALALAGAADTITVVMRGAIVQSSVEERMRGRVTAVDYVVGLSGGQLGSLESGALGSLTSPTISALSGGLATIVAAGLLALLLPGFRRAPVTPDPADEPGRAPA
ncbi:MAG TPA: MFS transporter [Solirubrobacteraceae bacterium]|nr:MFS transporter [Solirubrobacteraceae bacterium]